MAKKKNKEIPLVDAYLTSEVLTNLKPAPGEEIKPVATNSMPSEELFIERKEIQLGGGLLGTIQNLSRVFGSRNAIPNNWR